MRLFFKFIALLFLWGMVLALQADNYDKLWKRIELCQQSDLPRSALPLVDSIIRQAEERGDGGWLMKALLVRRQLAEDISPDSAALFIPLLEKHLQAEKNPAMQALYHCVLGYLWQHGAENTERYRQTEARNHYGLALAHPKELADFRAKDFVPLVVTGAEEEVFHGDLLNIVARFCGRSSQEIAFRQDEKRDTLARKIFHAALQIYRQQTNRRAESMLLMDSADVCISGEKRNFYSQMIGRFGDLDVGVEAYVRLAQESVPEEAYQLLKEAIGRYPKSKRMGELHNQLLNLTQPLLHLQVKGLSTYPGQEDSLLITCRNLRRAVLRFYTSHLKEGQPYRTDTICLRRPVLEIPIEMPARPPYEETEMQLAFRLPQPDTYFVRLEGDGIKSETEVLQVTRLHLMQLPLPQGRIRLMVSDALTGKPLEETILNLRQPRTGRLFQSFVTDSDGQALVKTDDTNRNLIIYATAAGKGSTSAPLRYGNYYHSYNEEPRQVLVLYTDRAIYRPGQEVHVGGFLYKKQGDSVRILAGENIILRLLDTNHKEIFKKSVPTDSFGNVQAEFTLPSHLLNGHFSISGQGGSVSFQVEEYKRPSFQVIFDEVGTAYKAGDTISISGQVKTYAEAPVAATDVKIQVSRRQAWWWRMSESSTPYFFIDSLMTDSEGRFRISVPLTIPQEKTTGDRLWPSPRFYTFSVHVTVTAQNGETEEGETTLSVGNQPSVLSMNLPRLVCKECPVPFSILQQNANGQSVSGKVDYSLLRDGQTITTGQWDCEQTLSSRQFENLPPGEYQLQMGASGRRDSLVRLRTEFTLFSLSDRRPASSEPLQMYATSREFRAGDTVRVLISTPLKDAWLHYDVFDRQHHLQNRIIPVSDTVLTFLFPPSVINTPTESDGIQIVAALVRNGKVHRQSLQISRAQPDKHLALRWKTFRDRLQPGQQETWTMQVLRNGKPAQASVMATLYDASLNKFAPLQWNLQFHFYRHIPNVSWIWSNVRPLYFFISEKVKYFSASDWDFSHFDESLLHNGLFFGGRAMGMRRGHVLMAKNANAASMDMVAAAAPMMEESKIATEATSAEEGTEPVQVSPRTNFAETAFFFPSLTTDKNGEVQFNFTLPESLTQWQFKALAHDREMNYGLADTLAIARKDFMLQPNVPRFLRAGDETQLAVTLRNLSEQPLAGKCQMELIDPATLQPIRHQELSFSISGQDATTVAFTVKATAQYPFLILRFTASNNHFSDGEQHCVPVLEDLQPALESMAFSMDGPEVKEVALNELLPPQAIAASHPTLTLEYTANPAWAAVEALPSMVREQNRDAFSLAQAYYALSMAATEAHAHPEIFRLARQWQAEGNPDSAWLPLERNPQLKQVLLSETPWVAQADAAHARLQGLAQLFDSVSLSFRLYSYQDRLLDLQGPQGGWSWFAGMPANPWTTLHVVESLARLATAAPSSVSNKVLQALERALRYLDTKAEERVIQLKQEEKKRKETASIGTDMMRYLYIVALRGWTPTPTRTYLLKRLERDAARYDMYHKALAARTLALTNRKEAAQLTLQSLMEHTVSQPAMGRWFDTRRAPSFSQSYRIPTQVAALEALRTIFPHDTTALHQMTLWLLQAKHTQAWDNPQATVDAVWWLMMQGQPLQASAHMAMPRITLCYKDGSETDVFTGTNQTQAATTLGYCCHHLDEKALHNLQHIRLRKADKQTSFAALYAQYALPADQLKAASSGLQLEVQWQAEGSSQWQSLAEMPPLAVGALIRLRYILTADRDYDFVSLKVPRAASTEPRQPLSGYDWRTGCYREVDDASLQYFMQHLPKGRHIIEETLRTDRSGHFTTGAPTLQCLYAPEFSARAYSLRLQVTATP